jgi:hypothetical protein
MRHAIRGAVLAIIGTVCGALLAAAASADPGNPDGPVGSVVFKPSLTLAGWSDFEATLARDELWMPKLMDDDDDPMPETRSATS